MQIVGSFVNRDLEEVGPSISSFMKIDSDIYNPEFDYRLEFRDPAPPPSLTLRLKVLLTSFSETSFGFDAISMQLCNYTFCVSYVYIYSINNGHYYPVNNLSFCTLFEQLITLDAFRRYAVIAGYALLNIFVESGTNNPPEIDQNALQVF